VQSTQKTACKRPRIDVRYESSLRKDPIMPNLHELIEQEAKTNIEDIKEVPPIPVGSYLAQIVGNYENVTSARKQTAGVQFTVRLISAMEDVDQDALHDYLDATNQTLHDVTIRYTIWESPYAMSTLKTFLLNSLGLSGPLKESLSRVPGQQLIASITHHPMQSDDGTMRLMAQIGSTARAT